MSATATTPAAAANVQVTARALASILGRNQGPELFFQQPFAPNQSPIIPKNLNVNRPMERLHIVWRGSVRITGANYAAVAAEAPQTIIQRIRLTGTHTVLKQLTPIDMDGATMFVWPRLFRDRSSSEYINGVRQPEPNVPFGQVGATFGNVGDYNVEIHYNIPVAPILPPANRLTGVPYLYMGKNWGDTLQLQLFFGDQTSFGTPAGGTTVVFGAFGTPGVGTPLVSIFQNFDILGPLANAVSSAVVIRSSQLQIAPVAAAANNIRIQLLQKQKTTNVLVKTGILQTGSGPGVQVFASLSDNILDMTQINVDNKPVRNNFNNFASKEYGGFVFSTVLPQGYLNFTFIDSMNTLTYYRGDQVDGASTFELDSNVLSSTANQAALIVQEQVFGTPQGGAQ